MLKFLKYIILFIFSVFYSCSPNKSGVKKSSDDFPVVDCDVKVEVIGNVNDIDFYLFQKSNTKSVTIERTLDLRKDSIEIFNLKSSSKDKIKIDLKTSDSYGEPVFVKIYINNELWVEESDSYQIQIDYEIPNPKELKL